MNKFLKFLTGLYIFVMPFQIKDVFFQEDFFIGKFSPYLSFELFLNDIIFVLILFVFAYLVVKKEIKLPFVQFKSKYLSIFLLLLLFVLVQSLFVDVKIIGVLRLLRIMEFGLLFLVFTVGILNKSEIRRIFIISISLQVIIALFQFVNQSSLGLSFLGESYLSPEMLNVAKIDFGPVKLIRAYGTFPHPNILGVFCGIAFLMALSLLHEKRFSSIFFMSLFMLGVLLSMSRGVMISLGLSFLLYFILGKRPNNLKKNMIFVFVFIISFLFLAQFDFIRERFAFHDSNTISERLMQIKISLAMIKEYPFGVGIGNFIYHMQEFWPKSLMPWQFQPVHNFWLYVTAELSFVVALSILALLFYSIYSFYKNKDFYSLLVLFFVFFVSNFDHYFYDIYSGQILLCFILVILYQHYYENLRAD